MIDMNVLCLMLQYKLCYIRSCKTGTSVYISDKSFVPLLYNYNYNITLLGAKIYPKLNLMLVSQLLYMVTGTHCDCGYIFCHYDAHAYI